MVKKKYKSKRLSLHKKYKIARKVREHKRQERKKEKLGQHKKKKDPGIPNNWPFKEELLQQVEQARLAEIESQKQAQQQRKEDKKERKRLEALERKNGGASALAAVTPLSVEMQAKKDLKESVKKADLVLIVLDARDPQGSRSLSLEDGLIGKGNKKVVLVLNKIDLISSDTAQKWLNYLRRFHPTIAVRALNERVLDTKVKTKAIKGQKALYQRAQELTGLRDNGFVDPLRSFLDEYSNKLENPGHVAVLGYPNVGKSTLINSIKKRALAAVSNIASTTKAALEVQYNDKLTLIDTPSLDPDYSDETSIVMRHSIANVWLEDPVPTVHSLLERANAVNLMQHLQLPVFKSHEDFLAKLAIKKNLLRKGGDPDILQMARTFLRDLGNSSYSTSCLPPAKSKSRFELPDWYTALDLTKMAELETTLFTSNPGGLKREILFTSVPVPHAAGDTTEYDLVLGQLPENDGLTSEDEDDEDMEEGDDDEDAEEMDEEEEEDDE
ncbi:hypothetical protein Poli38472_008316 [Pythium oligandrum]|uniref:CP-type G domain-containing protein n=1 Tax=Pythium oligandrum TaxID=41045 RepID=A0A8K1CM95_PYTOL|nr:hypothetical protein Poli38472_008316 [Pythium oligandrum]|eukprot:TMW65674.1 hypothetical protein Poli38472_008316 [Pythium oligandrum]